MNTAKLKLVERTVMRPVASAGRKPNKAYSTCEHLTQSEMAKLLAALKTNRHGHRDWLAWIQGGYSTTWATPALRTQWATQL